MPTFREYRIVMPLSLEEYEKAKEWHKAEQIKLDLKFLQDSDDKISVTEFGERTLLREQTQYIPSFYSEAFKRERIAEHVIKGYASTPEGLTFATPWVTISSFIDVLFKDAVKPTEVEWWSAFPYYCSTSTKASLGSKYRMVIESICIPGNVKEDNPLRLPDSILQKRQVVLVDIAGDVNEEHRREGKDPTLFRSEKTGRGPLEPRAWMDEAQPCLTCYIFVSIHYDFLGPLGTYAESKLHDGIQLAMQLYHREMFCLIDEWIDYPSNEILESVTNLQAELDDMVKLKIPYGDSKDAKNAGGDEECRDGVASFETDVTGKCCPISELPESMLGCCIPCGADMCGSSCMAFGFVSCIMALVAAFVVQSYFF